VAEEEAASTEAAFPVARVVEGRAIAAIAAREGEVPCIAEAATVRLADAPHRRAVSWEVEAERQWAGDSATARRDGIRMAERGAPGLRMRIRRLPTEIGIRSEAHARDSTRV
jgi:hypothetical protein